MRRTIYLSAWWLALVIPLAAQQTNHPLRQNSDTRQLSRAEQEAEEEVSLSADRIIEILRQEPGLLLQVKKLLVRQAFEQGRLIDPKDLTDEALFRLLREDDGTRVLATREIENRAYVKAKPSKEEIERLGEPRLRWRADQGTGSGAAANKTSESQEQVYWKEHEPRRPGASNLPVPPLQENPESPSAPPQEVVPENPARGVERTGLEPNFQPNGNEEQSLEQANRNLGPVGEELPGLVNGDASPTGFPRENLGMGRVIDGSAPNGQTREAFVHAGDAQCLAAAFGRGQRFEHGEF